MKTLIIGIDGGSCSGKTTLASLICKKLGGTVIHRDNYYLSRDDISLEERKNINYDCPEAFENDLLIEHLKMLKNGQGINSPIYDYTVHNRKKECIVIEPAELIIVDGIILFENEELRNCFNLKVFIDVNSDIRLKRRIERDTKTRGRETTDIKKQYNDTVQPMYERYIEPYKNMADMIITNDEFDKVTEKIKELQRG